MARIVVCGEALVDLVGEPDGRTFRANPGGSPANVAVGLARLGAKVTLVTGLGDDSFGRLVTDHVTASGVKLARQRCDFTTMAIVSLDEAGAASYDFAWGWVPGPLRLTRDTIALHTGSIAAALPGAEHVEQAMRAARGNLLVSYDPNIRPTLLASRKEERVRVERQVGLSDIVKASEEDLRWLYPGRDPIKVAHEWLPLGPSLVVVTQGGRGATAVGAAGTVHRAAAKVEVADTVGAGDAFMSGLLTSLRISGLLRRPAEIASMSALGMTPLLDHALIAAAVTVGRPGADPPYPAEMVLDHR